MARVPLSRAVQIGLLGVGALFGVSALVNFVAINETTLVNVGVIHALQPAVVAALAGRYLGERMDAKLLVWVSTAIGGAVLVAAASGGVGTWSLHGDLLAVLGLALNSTVVPRRSVGAHPHRASTRPPTCSSCSAPAPPRCS